MTTTPQDTKEKLVEELADIEHTRWANWQKYLFSLCTANTDGSFTIPQKSVVHWQRQIATKYEDLSEREKESDRKEVYKYINLVETYAQEREKQTEKAFGGCNKCYGKGYGTVIENASTRYETWSLPRMNYCTCDRGVSLAKEVELVAQERVRELRQKIETELRNLNCTLREQTIDTKLVTISQWNECIAPALSQIAQVLEGSKITARTYELPDNYHE
jgi:hypothetical protein